jgi:hypothetical protein
MLSSKQLHVIPDLRYFGAGLRPSKSAPTRLRPPLRYVSDSTLYISAVLIQPDEMDGVLSLDP